MAGQEGRPGWGRVSVHTGPGGGTGQPLAPSHCRDPVYRSDFWRPDSLMASAATPFPKNWIPTFHLNPPKIMQNLHGICLLEKES